MTHYKVQGVGMSCPGAGHCACCAGGAASPVLAVAALEGLAWLAAHVIEVAATAAVCGALAVAAVVALKRWSDRRNERRAAAGPLWTVRADAAPVMVATARPQVSRGTVPAIEHHHYGPQFVINGDSGQDVAARLIRQALAGAAPEHQEIRP